ncbi:type II toxin-antitoxin system PemK/MazF family toxin [Microcoleus sp. LEGE 07076]|uniref:type II toxin-antitoxin system PemK/MazF family toxin n=1 Tax=Microcoleus sp. LEGE 07076 TaxID=915322 RepID=UPI001D1558D1
MSCNRGDVVLVLFPNADLRTAKPRPVLIVQANNLGTGLGQTITAMITSNLARAGHPSRFFCFPSNTVRPANGIAS